MTKTLATEIHIQATPERVWQVLSDLAGYREWNPFIVEAAGRAVVGDRLTLRMQPVEGRAMTMRPTVVAASEGRLLRWLGRLGFPASSTPSTPSCWRPTGAGRGSSTRSGSAASWCRSSRGRWTGAPCRPSSG